MSQLNPDDERQLANQLMAADPSSAQELLERAERCRERGDRRLAEHFFRGAVEIAAMQGFGIDEQALMWVSLAQTLLELGEFVEAEEWARKAVNLPDTWELTRAVAYDALQTILTRNGKASEADSYALKTREILVRRFRESGESMPANGPLSNTTRSGPVVADGPSSASTGMNHASTVGSESSKPISPTRYGDLLTSEDENVLVPLLKDCEPLIATALLRLYRSSPSRDQTPDSPRTVAAVLVDCCGDDAIGSDMHRLPRPTHDRSTTDPIDFDASQFDYCGQLRATVRIELLAGLARILDELCAQLDRVAQTILKYRFIAPQESFEAIARRIKTELQVRCSSRSVDLAWVRICSIAFRLTERDPITTSREP